MQQPKVSVCVVTYNQENYIAECLQSIADQKTSFNYEVIVSDDCSTDNTPEIIKLFSEKYGFIKPVLRSKNVGAGANYFESHRLALGEYVCHCDGDDTFLPDKLQTQADFLDRNPEYSMSVHAAAVIGSGDIIGDSPALPEIASVTDLLKLGTYFIHSSVMYRRSCRHDYPLGFEAVDFYVHLHTAFKGPVHLNKSVLAGYRVHAGGVSSNPIYRDRIEKFYDAAYDLALENGISAALVRTAQIKRHLTFAFSRYFSGDVEGYKKRIKLNADEFQYASLLHKVLYWTRSMPVLMWCIKIARQIKNRKF
ncbi:Glycosyltransferase involved in cell wall bisynthesis [Rheinheimera pacifica]|uniref:Glycosyltransferase involved in cell wall bisynthesis n=1 Tax=Rheinheimera pacifica TaxID=173990 RepID=A0A1H6MMA6_9GAMM|nr:glycosyltransferase [Rheinheimera pacifica]SEH99003.1 Glycosyltransferase involved in cell wall bisynthesis [Rheinheimera pacifica]